MFSFEYGLHFHIIGDDDRAIGQGVRTDWRNDNVVKRWIDNGATCGKIVCGGAGGR